YWARSRVLEYLAQVQGRLPQGATASLGPDATGVGWVYEYALVDRTGRHDLAQLRSLQDWFLRYELKTVPGVAEVASIGGMVRQYQVVLDPTKLAAYGVTQAAATDALKRANQEAGGSVVEAGEAEYIVRASGYLKSLDDFRDVPLKVAGGIPVRLGDVATIQVGPEMRRGVAELNGEGEVAGGVIVMRSGKNAREVIGAVKARLDELKHGLGVNANIMSLGGIAIAIGAMVDAAVVMIENAHKHLERWAHDNPGVALAGEARWRVITAAATEVGPALFLSLLIITFSFIPVFSLQGQEGRLFAPLAFTKTYAMAGAAILSVTLVPVLMGWLIRGRIPAEHGNPVNRWLTAAYRPVIGWVLAKPRTVLVLAGLVFATTAWPLSQLGGEFMPAMDEGDLLYMPSALPGISTAKAGQLLQQTDRLIRTVPEVASVFGKAGRAETATDPAPMEMFETTIQFKPRDQWRAGMTPERLVEELDRAVKVPGLANIWVPPIRNRIDMLAT
ncbi:MAG: CusA/CzcA family heavy metal efflux RND transporter, partial [Sphingobium sp. 32-64-5]